MKLFVAIDVPEEIKNRALDVEEEIVKLQGKFAPVSREAMHITLNFIGEVSTGLSENAQTALDTISFSPFNIVMKGLSCFSPSFIRVVFVDVEEGGESLKQLYHSIGGALEKMGVPYERMDYTPHMTIARVKYIKDKSALLDCLQKHSGEIFGSFTVSSVSLKQSTLTEKGPQYTDLHKIER